MAIVRKYTKEKLKVLRANGLESFFYFQHVLLADKKLRDIHFDLCNFLQHDTHTRKLICAFRNSFKSTTMRAYCLWTGLYSYDLYGRDMSWMWVEQKWDNAVAHHIMLQNKFRIGDQALLLQDLYADRLPQGLRGWTNEHTILERKDANAENFLSVGSLDSKLEGKHRGGIMCDDLEGADAEKSDAPNEESFRFIEERAPDLLDDPSTGQVIIGGTPHGPRPLVWKIRDMDGGGTDNSVRKYWHIWWKEVVDENGISRFPERFPQDYVDLQREKSKTSKLAKRRWDTQLMLRRSSKEGLQFSVEKLEAGAWKSTTDYIGGSLKVLWEYPSIEFSMVEKPKEGSPGFTEKVRKKRVDPAECRFYIHWDPQHKGREERITTKSEYESSKHAIIVVAITPDWQVLVVEVWNRDCAVNVALEQFIRLYRKYIPWKWSYDPVGAQTWLVHHLKMLEEYKYKNIISSPAPWRAGTRRIPRPSQRAVEAHKGGVEKMEEIQNQLQIPVNEGWLHLNVRDEATMNEFEVFGESEGSFDILDALSQGPRSGIWKPPQRKEALLTAARRQKVREMSMGESLYVAPWADVSPVAPV